MDREKKVDITLHFDMSEKEHVEIFYDLVKFLHDRLPEARAVVSGEPEAPNEH